LNFIWRLRLVITLSKCIRKAQVVFDKRCWLSFRSYLFIAQQTFRHLRVGFQTTDICLFNRATVLSKLLSSSNLIFWLKVRKARTPQIALFYSHTVWRFWFLTETNNIWCVSRYNRSIFLLFVLMILMLTLSGDNIWVLFKLIGHLIEAFLHGHSIG